jgi:hypothetical protein
MTRENNNSVFVPTYTNILDTVATAERGRRRRKDGDGIEGTDEIEVNLMKYFLMCEHLVLTLPQACDNDALIRLASKSDHFLALIRNGFSSISLYGKFESLKHYTITQLKNLEFTFSNRRLGQLGKLPIDTQKCVRSALIKSIENDSKIGELPDDAKHCREDLQEYCLGIKELDSAYIGQYGKNLPTTATFPDVLKNRIETLSKEQFPVDEFASLFKDEASRSYYRPSDNSWYDVRSGDFPKNTLEQFLALVDLAYNQYMCSAIAPNYEWVAPSEQRELYEAIGSGLIDNRDTTYEQKYTREIDAIRSSKTLQCVEWDIVKRCLLDLKRKVELDAISSINKLQDYVLEQQIINYSIWEDSRQFESIITKTSSGNNVVAEVTTAESESMDVVQNNN